MKSELAQIRQLLIPWHRQWGTLGFNDEPPELPEGVLERLIKLAEENPQSEPVLRELVNVQCLIGHHADAIPLLQRVIALPGKRKPKDRIRDKAQLAFLLEKATNPEYEPDELLRTIELSAEQFVALGRFVRDESERNDEIAVTDYPLTRQWVAETLEYSEAQWEEFRDRLREADIFCDFGVREAFFEFAPDD